MPIMKYLALMEWIIPYLSVMLQLIDCLFVYFIVIQQTKAPRGD